jgi:hypothetical protein
MPLDGLDSAGGDARGSSWGVESMRFRFQLGENQFYARNFDVAVLGKRFIDITGDPDDVTLPLDRFGGSVAAYVILSHPIAKPLPVVSVQPDVIRYASHQYRRGFVRVDGPFEEYLKGLSSNKRSQLKRKVKKFKERSGGTIRFEEFKEPSAMRGFHALARQVSVKTYQEKLFKKGLPTHEAFLEDMEKRTREKVPRARGYLLFDGEKPIAYLYAVIDDGFLTYDYVGYDPDYGEWSPGNVLQYLILEKVFAERTCRIFDFGEGESQYKEFFSTDSMPCADIYYFPRDPKGYALCASQAGLYFVSRGIVRVLDRLGLKQRIKQMLRGHVASASGGAGSSGSGSVPPPPPGSSRQGSEGPLPPSKDSRSQAALTQAPRSEAPVRAARAAGDRA